MRFTALLSARFRQAALLTHWFGRVEPPRQVREPPAKKAARTKKERWQCAVHRPDRHKSQCQNDDHGQRDARDCIPSSGNDTNANSDEYRCHEKGDEVRNYPGLSNILNKKPDSRGATSAATIANGRAAIHRSLETSVPFIAFSFNAVITQSPET